MRRQVHALTLLILTTALALPGSTAASEQAEKSETFDEQVRDLMRHEGFIELYTDVDAGRILAALPAGDDSGDLLRFIHVLRLTRGLGSNPIGLDRGWGNSGRILQFRRIGDRILLMAENHRYRALTENRLEQNAVAESFASSFLWSTEILARADDGRTLIDLQGFLTLDELGLAQRLSSDGGAFKQADDRSLPDTSSVLAFPDNVEIDAWMTFTGTEPGAQIRATAADANSVTLVQHHSFVRLPDDGYQVREADPRSGSFELAFRDFAAPLDEAIVSSYAVRQRLQYVETGNPASGIAEPIVFYIDSGAPHRIREALVEGASWWADAFEAAGFPGGFRVEILPEGAHPLDVRYNVVQWVHRQTRGWSYGGGVIDPRTGEMIKGHVILGSQRVRQDRMIFEGLAGVEATGTGRDDDPVELSLDRIRQLSAHEVGHALGFGHNFAASSRNRASVMDYPAPWIDVRDGVLDFSRAYDHGIGEWDRVSARWLYAEFAPGADESAALDQILTEAFGQGQLYIADEHGRSVGGAHPDASVWDNGSDPVVELKRALDVRDHALARFGIDRLAEGRPLAELRRVLVPIYLFHRYQVDAAAKSLGGHRFEYGKRGAAFEPLEPVSAAVQQRALEALLETLTTDRLDLPDAVLDVLPPGTRGFGYADAPAEIMASRTGPIFDLFTAVEIAADITLTALLDARRAERLVQQSALDRTLPSLDGLLRATEARIADNFRNAKEARSRLIAQRIAVRYLAALIGLDTPDASGELRAVARSRMTGLLDALPRSVDDDWKGWVEDQVKSHLDRPAPALDPLPNGPDRPQGSPIGSASTLPSLVEECWHCR